MCGARGGAATAAGILESVFENEVALFDRVAGRERGGRCGDSDGWRRGCGLGLLEGGVLEDA